MASSEASTQPSSAEASTQESQTQSQRNVRAKTDIAWGHAIIVLDGGKEKPQCIYCKKIIKGGGINRLKLHLAGETGQVEACGQAPAEVRFKMQQNREETRLKKRKAEGNEVQIGNEEQRQRVQPRTVVVASQKEKGTNSGSFDNYFLPRTTPGSQPTIKSALQTKEVVEKCDLAIAKWFIATSIPFNAANSPYFQCDLANMTIQPISNDIDGLNLDEDDDCGNDAPDTNAENMDQSNVLDEAAREDAEFLDELEIQSILTPWN